MTRIIAMLCAMTMLAACASDPLGDVPRLSETDLAEGDLQASIRAEPGDGAALPRTEVSTAEAPGSGILGFLRRAADAAKEDAPAGSDPEARVASATAVPAPSLSGPKPGDPDFQVVSLGTVLPYGALARVCNVPTRQLGQRVERYPDRRSTYALYDSQPGNTAPHTFYLTGFDDGCARQFTAALAVFGSPRTHEQLRYGLPSQVQPYSSTDAAYESLKSRICRVGKGKPCGRAMSRLEKDTVFVSVYETFGSNPVWKTILLHDGKVVETDIRGG